MLSFSIHAPNSFLDFSPRLFPRLNSFEVTGSRSTKHCSRRGKRKKQELMFLAAKETSGVVVLELRDKQRDSCWGCGFGGGFLRRCSEGCGWESREEDFALEAEILKFMENSKNPEMFPSKKDLVDAGRADLVDAILKQGGWLASGWDFDDDEPSDSANDDDVVDWDSLIKNDEHCSDVPIQGNFLEGNEEESSSVSCSSGRSLETAAEDDSGIDGILCRLQKERNMNLGFALREIGSSTGVQSSDLNCDWLSKTSKDVTLADQKGKGIPGSFNSNNGLINDSEPKLDLSRSVSNFDVYGNSLMPDMRRASSIQRAGVSTIEFEAEEFDSDRTRMEGRVDTLRDDQNQIQRRLQHLELELSSVLQKLKSSNGESVSQKGNERSSDELLTLSDAWEFQENEIMNAQDKLRSMRAQLAVLEGKMALAIIDAQKSVEEKQQRIDDARRALQLLRSACIVWPGSASEVLVAGSFDGWATQRRMNKTSVGIFSLYLKLYPGRYEIKFIVDGEWRIDPLRPIVHNNGYENNLLIIT